MKMKMKQSVSMKFVSAVASLLAACSSSQSAGTASPAAPSSPRTRARLELRVAGGPAFLTTEDLVSCASGRDGEYAVVRCRLTAEGARKLNDSTTAHIGEPVEIAIDGVVGARPTIVAPMTTADLTLTIGSGPAATAEATRIATALSP